MKRKLEATILLTLTAFITGCVIPINTPETESNLETKHRDNFIAVMNAGIPGYNKETYNNKSLSQCKRICLDRSWCKSIDFERKIGKCFVQDANKADAALKTNYPGNPYDHYYRIVSLDSSAENTPENKCYSMVQGKVAWNQSGNTSWQEANIRKLCSGTKNPHTTIGCFQNGISAHNDWNKAISDCSRTKRAIEAGPIWNQNDANTKCPNVAYKNKGTWTGQWWTTIQGKMSVCEIRL